MGSQSTATKRCFSLCNKYLSILWTERWFSIIFGAIELLSQSCSPLPWLTEHLNLTYGHTTYLKVCVPLRCSPVSLCSYSLSLSVSLFIMLDFFTYFQFMLSFCPLFICANFFITLSRTKCVPDRKKDKSLWASFSLPLKWQIQTRWSLIHDLVKTLSS